MGWLDLIIIPDLKLNILFLWFLIVNPIYMSLQPRRLQQYTVFECKVPEILLLYLNNELCCHKKDKKYQSYMSLEFDGVATGDS